MKNELERMPNIPQIQQEMLDFWKKDDTFNKSVNKPSKDEVVFYDGPPFPTGKPHHGTVLVSFIKDMIARYQTMQGNKVARQWGWDCHGLPIEVQAEGVLGITDKSEIEKSIGVAKFNEQCRAIVSQNDESWREYVENMARWVDYDNAYRTMDKDYMESVIWAFREMYNKGYIYKDFRVTPYCTRCETALSISDTRESDSTRPKQDRWVMVKFKADTSFEGKPTYFLAWTTTPWTLPSNMALAIGEKVDYSYVEVDGEVYILGSNAVGNYKQVFGDKPNILKQVKGSALIGQTYTPLFDFFMNKKAEGAFRVVAVDYIDEGEGVCIVHTAPAFGEDDYWTCKRNNIPLVCPVDQKGIFTAEVPLYEGKMVFDANNDIINYLKANNSYMADGTLVHNYPHCWRCGKPLIYKAMEAWYLSVDKLKNKLIEKNEEVNWIPDYFKAGRFGNWLSNARDWNISRNRYWSTPIPVWECDCCKSRKVLGSIAEIEKESGQKVTDLHKQFLDKIEFKCACGGTYKRVPEVLDCWFESGSAPFARIHYPFENKAWFDKHATSDFVVEYTGQIRCWFYYLHVLSVGLFDKPAYKNCIAHGTVLAKDGKKLSKKSKNYTDPMELMKSYGTDAFRLYMFQSNAMTANDMMFDENGLKDSLQQIILPYWNCAYFYQSYANIDGFVGDEGVEPNSSNSLDKWILASLFKTEKEIKTNMDNYRIDSYVKPIADFLNGLSNWYIRRSRRRFWTDGMNKDKQDAYETLYYVLTKISKILAPIMPLISEKVYKALTNKESVHLELWPDIPTKYNDTSLLKEIDLVQDLIHLARNIRNKNNIKNRQPLSMLKVASTNKSDYEIIRNYAEVIKEELNIKNIEIIDNIDQIADVVYKVNFATVGKTMGQMIPVIQKAIKENTLQFNGIQYFVSEANLTLNKEDILVSFIAKGDLPVFSDSHLIVALDLTITPELREEGIAREIVRNIQDARKQMDLNIMDRIKLELVGDISQEYLDYISVETLADYTTIYKPDFETTVEGIVIKIQK